MRRVVLTFANSNGARVSKFAAALVLASAVAIPALAQQPGQKTFSSAQQASEALVAAAQSNDEKALISILGPDAKNIVSSGDQAADSAGRATFVQKYRQMHRLFKEPDGTTTLYIGAENWPTPIPLIDKGHMWYFDTAAGKKEILYRRVGENEMSAIRVCQQLAAAQKDYDSTHHQYAAKIFSDPGQRNGLYWKASANEPKSPVGPLLAAAVAKGYAKDREGNPTPFRGYYYHMLISQGKTAPGGAKNYVVDGKMTAGFAFIAYPAEYRSSGVMTFIVSQNGVVYRKDLGPKTDDIAQSMQQYNLDPTWTKDEDQQELSAAIQPTK